MESAKDPAAEKNLKSTLSGCVRYTLENKLNIPPAESGHQMSTLFHNSDAILKNNDIGTIIDFLATPKELYGKINKH